MKKILIAIAVSAVMLAPITSHAESDVMLGAGFGYIDIGTGSATGFMFGAQMKLNEKSAIGLNYHEGDIFAVTYRGYLNKYADGLFWEAGVLSGGSATAFEGGVGFDVPLQNKLVLRGGAGAIIGSSGSTAFAARGGIYYAL